MALFSNLLDSTTNRWHVHVTRLQGTQQTFDSQAKEEFGATSDTVAPMISEDLLR